MQKRTHPSMLLDDFVNKVNALVLVSAQPEKRISHTSETPTAPRPQR